MPPEPRSTRIEPYRIVCLTVIPTSRYGSRMLPARETSSKARLMDAATQVIRTKGYSATTVEEICHAATLTKGSFFHHFKSKDDLALATVLHWNASTEQLFADADYRKARDPLDRLLGYV